MNSMYRYVIENLKFQHDNVKVFHGQHSEKVCEKSHYIKKTQHANLRRNIITVILKLALFETSQKSCIDKYIHEFSSQMTAILKLQLYES